MFTVQIQHAPAHSSPAGAGQAATLGLNALTKPRLLASMGPLRRLGASLLTLEHWVVVRAVAKTDVGRVRDHNEDAFLVEDTYQVYVVADGMGGHAGGAQASELVVKTIKEHLARDGALLLDDAVAAQALADLTEVTASGTPVDILAEEALGEQEPFDHNAASDMGLPDAPLPEGAKIEPADYQDPITTAAAAIPYVVYDVWDPGIAQTSVAPVVTRMLADGVRLACNTIYRAAAEDPALMGMGTTTTVLCIHKNWAYVAHVGDSRCYVQRDGALMQITEDHSLVNEQIKAGLLTPELARVSRHKNIITRSVGFEPNVEVDCFMLPTRPGDQYVLCSDGLSNLIEDIELGETMMQLQGQALVDFLVTLALDRGGDDNITVITVDVLDDMPSHEK